MKRASFITNADATEGLFWLASAKLFLFYGNDAATLAAHFFSDWIIHGSTINGAEKKTVTELSVGSSL